MVKIKQIKDDSEEDSEGDYNQPGTSRSHENQVQASTSSGNKSKASKTAKGKSKVLVVTVQVREEDQLCELDTFDDFQQHMQGNSQLGFSHRRITKRVRNADGERVIVYDEKTMSSKDENNKQHKLKETKNVSYLKKGRRSTLQWKHTRQEQGQEESLEDESTGLLQNVDSSEDEEEEQCDTTSDSIQEISSEETGESSEQNESSEEKEEDDEPSSKEDENQSSSSENNDVVVVDSSSEERSYSPIVKQKSFHGNEMPLKKRKIQKEEYGTEEEEEEMPALKRNRKERDVGEIIVEQPSSEEEDISSQMSSKNKKKGKTLSKGKGVSKLKKGPFVRHDVTSDDEM